MSVLGWILSAVLALAFFAAGMAKLATPRSKLIDDMQMAWATDFSEAQVKGIGALEVLGALGVVLPWLLNIAPALTPIAAIGCAVIMVGAFGVHVRRHEPQGFPPTLVLLALAVAVASIRFSQL